MYAIFDFYLTFNQTESITGCSSLYNSSDKF